MTERAEAANDLLSKDIIYTYWKDYGQFGGTTNCTTGHYANSAYTDASEFLSYDTSHFTDRKRKAIMLHGVNEFSTIFEKYEGISIRHSKATLSAITTCISKLLVVPSAMNIRDVQPIVKLLYRFANTTPERYTAHWSYQSATLIVRSATRLWLAVDNALD